MRIVAIALVVVFTPIERIMLVDIDASGSDATGSGCCSQRSFTSSRCDVDNTSPPAVCAVSYEMYA